MLIAYKLATNVAINNILNVYILRNLVNSLPSKNSNISMNCSILKIHLISHILKLVCSDNILATSLAVQV